MEEKLVSILIPVYNREYLIVETIQNAINQTYKNIEIIISDNKSTDNTFSIIKEIATQDKRIKIHQNEQNVGPVLNWLQCLKMAKGEFAKILWSDDKISNNFIEETMKLFDDDTAFVMSKVEIFEHETGEIIYKTNYNDKAEYLVEDYFKNILIHNKKGFMVSPGCAIFRLMDIDRSLIIDIPNSQNLDFKRYGAGNDLLVFLLTALNYKKVKIATNTTSYFRSHKQSISVDKKDEMDLYYEWSKSFFIENYYRSFLGIYKAKIAMHQMKNPKLKELYKNINIDNKLKYVFDFIKLKFDI